MTCSSCTRPVLARGLCANHYGSWRRRNNTRLCGVDGCESAYSYGGYCETHAWRKRKYGSVDGAAAPRPTLTSRFWMRVTEGPEGECWEWAGWRNEKGYGVLSGPGSKKSLAHRVSLFITGALARLDDPSPVLHSCDNPPCVNPAHLRVGTFAENNADAVARDRLRPVRGEQFPQAKLTEERVRAIRAAPRGHISTASLAAEFGVSESLVQKVQRRQAWKHIP